MAVDDRRDHRDAHVERHRLGLAQVSTRVTKAARKPAVFIWNWSVFWEGALITHFWGLWWALAWCLAWFVISRAVRFGIFIGKQVKT